MPDGTFWAEGLLVHNCDPCKIADDGVVRSLDDPVLQAIMPPNPECNGGDFCRCLLVYVLADDPAALDLVSG